MERRCTTDPGRMRAMRGFRAWLLAGAGAAALAWSPPALGQVSRDERVYRLEALAHAHAVEAAWRRLETFILEDSAGPVSWSGATPPASAGWEPGWTARGLEARYCDDVLLVYLAPGRLKGVGRDHRAVHAAPHAYGGGRAPALHWLENGAARGGEGRAAVALPACLSAAAAGGPLPSGRAALAGTVRDPFLHTAERVTRERREEPCGDGEHGQGRTLVREVTRAYDGRGGAVGDPVEGAWEVSLDLCRDDYSQWEHYTLACHWDAGPPHDRRMEGREVWRRERTVTAAGETLGPPAFVSTSCWTGAAPPPAPVPAVSEASHQETRTESCPEGHVGSLGYRRTVTLRSTRFPWDAAPVTQTIRGAWALERDDCVPEEEPDWDPGDPDDGDDGPDDGNDNCGGCEPGTGKPGDDTCGQPDFGDGGGGCFLTTAVATLRGEADNGPTLTALRGFRDGYMARTAARRALVAEYYALAPGIVAAIPAGHADWRWIAARIDAAAAAIAAGDGDGAFAVYAAMVRRLKDRWLPFSGTGERP